jgi:tetratricopeptide (TPR) repeat protein
MITNLTMFIMLMQFVSIDGQVHEGLIHQGIPSAADSNGYDSESVEIDSTMLGPNDVELMRKRRERQDVAALNDRGNRYRKLGLLDKAETCFKKAFEKSDSVYIALNLSELYTAQGRFEEAKTLLEVASRRTPASGDAYYGLALVYFKQGRLEEVEVAALQAHRRPHWIADVHLLLAKVYARSAPEKVRTQLELYLHEAPNGAESERVRKMLEN